MIILWIDPWTTTTGFAIIEKISKKEPPNDYNLIDYGIFSTTPKTDLSIKLLEIWTDIKELISKFNPDIISIEKLFFQTNTKTAIDVAQARWVILYEAMKNNLNILEYTPLQVKKAITLNWKANKLQLQNSIKIIFKLDEIPKPDDAADAIWLAYMWALNSNNLNWLLY
jgi:crossover junction endodeoxyribonuclease RuvC